MLFMLGALSIDVYPFNADTVMRSDSADIASKPVLSGLKAAEIMGPGDNTITLRGQLLPSKIGGLGEFESLREHKNKGARLPLMRGDGTRLGTYMITRIHENHRQILADGNGGVIRHSVTLKQVPEDRAGIGGGQTIPALLELFNFLG